MAFFNCPISCYTLLKCESKKKKPPVGGFLYPIKGLIPSPFGTLI